MKFWTCFGNHESSATYFQFDTAGHPASWGGSTQSFFQQQLIVCLVIFFFFKPPSFHMPFPLPDPAWCRILALDPNSCITPTLLLYSAL